MNMPPGLSLLFSEKSQYGHKVSRIQVYSTFHERLIIPFPLGTGGHHFEQWGNSSTDRLSNGLKVTLLPGMGLNRRTHAEVPSLTHLTTSHFSPASVQFWALNLGKEEPKKHHLGIVWIVYTGILQDRPLSSPFPRPPTASRAVPCQRIALSVFGLTNTNWQSLGICIPALFFQTQSHVETKHSAPLIFATRTRSDDNQRTR